jgi:hypothetical protein
MLICKLLFCALYLHTLGSTLWSSGPSSWLQIKRSGFDSRCYQIFREVVGLERSPLSLVSTTEELLERKSSSSDLENREYGDRDPSRCPRGTFYPQKLALTPPTSGGRSVGKFARELRPRCLLVCLHPFACIIKAFKDVYSYIFVTILLPSEYYKGG